MLIETVEKQRNISSFTLANDENLNPNNVSDRTIRRVLFDNGLVAKRPKRGFIISEKNKILRTNFAEKMLNTT
jgi:hypothetical protein